MATLRVIGRWGLVTLAMTAFMMPVACPVAAAEAPAAGKAMPFTVAAVYGARYMVASNDSGETAVVVAEGSVRVQAAGVEVEVPAGYGVVIPPGQGPGQPRPMPFPEPPAETSPPAEQTAPPSGPSAPGPLTDPTSGPAAPSAGMSAFLTTRSAGQASVVSFGLNPEFRFGPIGLSLDLNLHYTSRSDRLGLFFDPATGEVVDAQSVEQGLQFVPQLVRWVEYDVPAFGVRWGRLNRITLGQGVLLADYALNDQVGQKGLRLRADLEVGGGMMVVPTDLAGAPTPHLQPNVAATRLFVRPLRPMPLEVGLQAALERHEVPGRSPPGPLRAYALDAIYPLSATVAVYAQAGTMEAASEQANLRQGVATGLAGIWGPLVWRGEHRLATGFPFGYFNAFYETRASSAQAASLLNLPGAWERVDGYLIQASLQVPWVAGLAVGASYESHRGGHDRLGLVTSIRLPASLEAQVEYYQSPVRWDPFRLDSAGAAVVADLRYPLRPGLLVVMRRIHSFAGAGASSLQLTTEFTL